MRRRGYLLPLSEEADTTDLRGGDGSDVLCKIEARCAKDVQKMRRGSVTLERGFEVGDLRRRLSS